MSACDSDAIRPLCSTALVVITIEDLNDNAPQFSTEDTSLDVVAERMGYLGRVFATDLDAEGPNSALNYQIMDESRLLTIDNFGRIFTKEALKADTRLEFKLSVMDGGNPPLYSKTDVRLSVKGMICLMDF